MKVRSSACTSVGIRRRNFSPTAIPWLTATNAERGHEHILEFRTEELAVAEMQTRGLSGLEWAVEPFLPRELDTMNGQLRKEAARQDTVLYKRRKAGSVLSFNVSIMSLLTTLTCLMPFSQSGYLNLMKAGPQRLAPARCNEPASLDRSISH